MSDSATICKLPDGSWRTIWHHANKTAKVEAPKKRIAKKRILGFTGTFHKVEKDELWPKS